MTFAPTLDKQLPGNAAHAADQAIRATQHATNRALDGLADGAQHLRDCAVPAVNRTADHSSELAQRGLQAIRQSSRQLRDGARRTSDGTVSYIRDEPVKSMLFAAAAGAVVMLLLGRRTHAH